MDIIIVVLLTVITFPVLGLTDGLPRIILGVVFILVFPGYTLTAAIFPKKSSIKGVERATLTLALSFALVSLTGLALNYTQWGIQLTPILVSMAIIIFLTSGVALFRRRRLPEAERFVLSINYRLLRWGSLSRFDRVLTLILAMAVIGTVFTLSYIMVEPKANENFTSFYILGPEGKMENYPQEIILGEQVALTLGIENYEDSPVIYDVAVMLDGEMVQELSHIEIDDGEEWSDEVVIIPPKAGDDQRVEFILYKRQEAAPYLSLHFWLDVKE